MIINKQLIYIVASICALQKFLKAEDSLQKLSGFFKTVRQILNESHSNIEEIENKFHASSNMLVDAINQRTQEYINRTEEQFENATNIVEASIIKDCFKYLNFKNIASTTYSIIEACRIVPTEQAENYVNKIKSQIEELSIPIDKIEETANTCSEIKCYENTHKEALQLSQKISGDISKNIEQIVDFSVAKLKIFAECAIYEVRRLFWRMQQNQKRTSECVNTKVKEKINLFEL